MIAIRIYTPPMLGGVRVPQVDSEYLGVLLDPRFQQGYIDRAVRTLEAGGTDFDAIAFTGVSGGLTGPLIAYALGKSLIVVRKTDDKSTHSPRKVEGDRTAESYIIVDDFFSTGTTAGHIIKAIASWSFASCVGGLAVIRPDEWQSHYSYRLYPGTDREDVGKIPNLAYKREGYL